MLQQFAGGHSPFSPLGLMRPPYMEPQTTRGTLGNAKKSLSKASDHGDNNDLKSVVVNKTRLSSTNNGLNLQTPNATVTLSGADVQSPV